MRESDERANVSIGLPLDMLVDQEDSLAVTRYGSIDEQDQYFHLLRTSWGRQRLWLAAKT